MNVEVFLPFCSKLETTFFVNREGSPGKEARSKEHEEKLNLFGLPASAFAYVACKSCLKSFFSASLW